MRLTTRRFSSSTHLRNDRGCDILHCFLGYVQTFGEQKGEDDKKDNLRILVDLDDRAYISISLLAACKVAVLAGCLPEWKDQYLGCYKRIAYALLDIKEDREEILVLVEEGGSFMGSLEFAWDRFELY
jgi:hypothetical protein